MLAPQLSLGACDVTLHTFEGQVPPPSSEREVYIQKPAEMLARLTADLVKLAPRRMLELGLFHGGSTIYWRNQLALDRLIAIDIRDSVPALESYVQRHADDVIRLHLGVSQDDKGALYEIWKTDLPHQALDVVIDDASHQYAESLASFEALFPLMREGGAYIIEDWGWGHGMSWPDDLWSEFRLLSPLITELMLLCASRNRYIERIEINDFYVTVWRGMMPIDHHEFRLKDHYRARGFALP
jgi:SAM-dependent methyltransferase